jgi:hypothetical protein
MAHHHHPFSPGPCPEKRVDAANDVRHLRKFAKRLRRRLLGMAAAPPDTVIVTDGMGRQTKFSTINAALKSITDASAGNEYSVSIGPGTYNETISLKPWVFVKGASQTSTVISGSVGAGVPTVTAAANSGLSFCGITASGAKPDQRVVAVAVASSPSFVLSECNLTANDAGVAQVNVFGITVDYPSGGNSTAFASFLQINITAENPDSYTTGIVVSNAGLLQIESSSISPTAGVLAIGGASINAAGLDLDTCTVSGNDYALYLDDSGATCTATDCMIEGPVSPGVVIHKD